MNFWRSVQIVKIWVVERDMWGVWQVVRPKGIGKMNTWWARKGQEKVQK